MTIKAVLFDMDGVLLLSIEMWFKTFNYARKHYAHKPVSRIEFMSEVINKGGIVPAVVRKYFPGADFRDFSKLYFGNAGKFFRYSRINFGAENILKKLRENRIKIAVVTNTYGKTAAVMLRNKHLSGNIDVLVGGDNVRNPKPNPEGLFLACRKLKVNKNEAIYVGDAESDLITARRAKIRFVGYKREGDFRINNLEKLINITFK